MNNECDDDGKEEEEEEIPELVPREKHYFSDNDEKEDESPSEQSKERVDTPNNQPYLEAKWNATVMIANFIE